MSEHDTPRPPESSESLVAERPAADDLLAPVAAAEPGTADAPVEEAAAPRDAGSEKEAPSDDGRPAERPRDSRRSFLEVGWALVAVVAIAAVLIFAGILRISSELNNSTCIQRAQANYAVAQGPGLTVQDAQFARFALSTSLKKCGH